MAKKDITVTLYMSELVYDVQNKSYLTGRSRATGENYEAVSHMQASDQVADTAQIVRSLSNAFGVLKSELSEWLDPSATSSDNILMDASEEDTLVLTLRMPSNYNGATAATLSSEMHQYLVHTALGDWFLESNKADAGDYYKQASANLLQLSAAINKRTRPRRDVDQ